MQIAEIFESINGEGACAGQRALFLRFPGCNLDCSWCDTAWVNDPAFQATDMTLAEILQLVEAAKIRNLTITGGEPLLQPDLPALLQALAASATHRIEIETNGSVNLAPFLGISDQICFTMDYKLPGSGMEDQMCRSNFALLGPADGVKFVVGSREDLVRAGQIIVKEGLADRCHIWLSPVFGQIDPEEMVNFLKEEKLDRVNLSLQLHKIIWDPDKRGV